MSFNQNNQDEVAPSYDLHKAVFNNDLPGLSGLFRASKDKKIDVSTKELTDGILVEFNIEGKGLISP